MLAPTTVKLTERKVAVLGPNGSGKSTFLRLLNGLNSPTVGNVTVNGLPVGQERSKTGFLFADPAAQLIMPTVAEDVQLSLQGFTDDRGSWWTKFKRTFQPPAAAAIAPEVLEALDRVGVASLADRSIFDLSSGQRQLVALATVLVRKPHLLLADEPTTLLDLANTVKIKRILLQALEDEQCQQLIFATHDFELARMADRAIVFVEGQLVFDSAPEQAIAWYRNEVACGRC